MYDLLLRPVKERFQPCSGAQPLAMHHTDLMSLPLVQLTACNGTSDETLYFDEPHLAHLEHWNIICETTAFNLLVWQVQIFLKKTGCTMPLARFVFSKSKGLIIRVIQGWWYDCVTWLILGGADLKKWNAKRVMTGLSNGSWEPHGTSCFLIQVSAVAELHPLVVDFAEDPLGSRQILKTWKVQTWFVFVCVWRKNT